MDPGILKTGIGILGINGKKCTIFSKETITGLAQFSSGSFIPVELECGNVILGREETKRTRKNTRSKARTEILRITKNIRKK